MLTPVRTVTLRRSTVAPASHGVKDVGDDGSALGGIPEASYWVEPGTSHAYPMSYQAYRRTREAEEKPPPRHRGLGSEIDHYVWRRWRRAAVPDVEVLLTFRPGAPPRVRRIVAEILLAIRRGESPGKSIRRVARQFGLRHTRALAFITAAIGFEMRPRQDAPSSFVASHCSPNSTLADWI